MLSSKPLAGIAAAWSGTGFPYLAKISHASHLYQIGRLPQILYFRIVGIPKRLAMGLALDRRGPLIPDRFHLSPLEYGGHCPPLILTGLGEREWAPALSPLPHNFLPFRLLGDDFVSLFQGGGDFVFVRAASLGHVGAAAAAATHHGGDGFDDLAGGEALGEVFAH
jgi:hypothetical protein